MRAGGPPGPALPPWPSIPSQLRPAALGLAWGMPLQDCYPVLQAARVLHWTRTRQLERWARYQLSVGGETYYGNLGGDETTGLQLIRIYLHATQDFWNRKLGEVSSAQAAAEWEAAQAEALAIYEAAIARWRATVGPPVWSGRYETTHDETYAGDEAYAPDAPGASEDLPANGEAPAADAPFVSDAPDAGDELEDFFATYPPFVQKPVPGYPPDQWAWYLAFWDMSPDRVQVEIQHEDVEFPLVVALACYPRPAPVERKRRGAG